MKIFKRLAILFLLIVIFSVVSWCSFYGFYIAARLFYSVPVARACDAIGGVILVPARLFLRCFRMADQSSALADPMFFATINGTLLGIICYGVMRTVGSRRKIAEDDQSESLHNR